MPGTLLMIVAGLAGSLPGSPTPADAVQFDCTGRGKSNGYPYGAQTDRADTGFRVTAGGGQVAVIRRDGGEYQLCQPGANCVARVADDLLELRVDKVPGYDPIYSVSFVLDRRALSFEAHGGGLDGGWSVAGTCTPAAP